MMIPMADRLVAARVAFEAADMMNDGFELELLFVKELMISTFISKLQVGALSHTCT